MTALRRTPIADALVGTKIPNGAEARLCDWMIADGFVQIIWGNCRGWVSAKHVQVEFKNKLYKTVCDDSWYGEKWALNYHDFLSS